MRCSVPTAARYLYSKSSKEALITDYKGGSSLTNSAFSLPSSSSVLFDQFLQSKKLYQCVIENAEVIGQKQLCSRIVSRDSHIWSEFHYSEQDLAWVDSADQSIQTLSDIKSLSPEVDSLVLIGMGGTNLAAKSYACIKRSESSRNLIVLDSTNPDFLAPVFNTATSSSAHYLVSSKSGSTIETIDISRTLYERVPNPTRFTVITDPTSSPIRNWANDNGIEVVSSDPQVPGRFSSLSTLSLLPAKLLGISLQEIYQSYLHHLNLAQTADSEVNRKISNLAAVMTAAAREPTSSLQLTAPISFFPVLQWLEQLVSESLGQSGFGILPTVSITPAHDHGEFTLAANIRTMQLEPVTVYTAELTSISNLVELFLTWQTAVTITGIALGVFPFDQPEVENSKHLLRKKLSSTNSNDSQKSGFPQRRCEGDLEDIVRNFQEMVDELLKQSSQEAYIAILAYVTPTNEHMQALAKLSAKIEHLTQLRTTWSYGPQYLHSTGQFHKGGPQFGRFLILYGNAGQDMEITRRPYTFEQLSLLQAQTDAEFLKRKKGSPLYWIQLSLPILKSIEGLIEAVE